MEGIVLAVFVSLCVILLVYFVGKRENAIRSRRIPPTAPSTITEPAPNVIDANPVEQCRVGQLMQQHPMPERAVLALRLMADTSDTQENHAQYISTRINLSNSRGHSRYFNQLILTARCEADVLFPSGKGVHSTGVGAVVVAATVWEVIAASLSSL
jgi:hypothetical protein